MGCKDFGISFIAMQSHTGSERREEVAVSPRTKNAAASSAPLSSGEQEEEPTCSSGDGNMRILLALFGNECPWAALSRARSLALLMEAELHVVRVLPPLTRPRRLFSKPDTADVLGALKRTLAASRATRAWVTEALGQDLPKGRLKLLKGEFYDQVAARASELEVGLIIVAPRPDHRGRKVTWLARTAATPVLVAREVTSRDAIVAGTDLCEHRDPVLRNAADLCRRLEVQMVLVHNLTPVLLAGGPDMPVPVTIPVQHRVAALWKQSLIEAAHALQVDVEAVLGNERDPAEAILKAARAYDADLIIVGTHQRGWFERLMGHGVSARVVNQARRSVLVTPLGADAGSARGATRRPPRAFFARGGPHVRKTGASI
jgi:nucleotide-binding universal stress UspA family protein